MARIAATLLAVAVALGVTACGGGSSSSTSDEITIMPTPERARARMASWISSRAPTSTPSSCSSPRITGAARYCVKPPIAFPDALPSAFTTMPSKVFQPLLTLACE